LRVYRLYQSVLLKLDVGVKLARAKNGAFKLYLLISRWRWQPRDA